MIDGLFLTRLSPKLMAPTWAPEHEGHRRLPCVVCCGAPQAAASSLPAAAFAIRTFSPLARHFSLTRGQHGAEESIHEYSQYGTGTAAEARTTNCQSLGSGFRFVHFLHLFLKKSYVCLTVNYKIRHF
jgi:hypothetical protein